MYMTRRAPIPTEGCQCALIPSGFIFLINIITKAFLMRNQAIYANAEVGVNHFLLIARAEMDAMLFIT